MSQQIWLTQGLLVGTAILAGGAALRYVLPPETQLFSKKALIEKVSVISAVQDAYGVRR